MLNKSVASTRIILAVCFAALTMMSGLTSCGGGSIAGQFPDIKTSVQAYATPSVVASGGTATITWQSTDANDCSTTPLNKIASGTSTGIAGEFTTTALTENTTFTISCTGDTGNRNQPVTVTVGSTTYLNAAQCSTYGELGGTKYYYCDCGTGATAGCVAGNDSNPGTDPALPRRTLANAITRLNSLAANQSVMLCRGGAFNAAAGFSIGTSRCAAGSTCNDLRDYTPPTFAGTVKPIINSASGSGNLFSVTGNTGGVRFINLTLKGQGSSGNRGFFFYNGGHDVTMCNLDMDNFDMPLYLASNAGLVKPSNIIITGNNITNSHTMGFLGGADDTVISYNNWEGNGSSTVYDHTLYFSAGEEVRNMTVIGNDIHGQYGSTCLGSPIVGHGAFDGFQFNGNVISIDASATTAGCWGMGFNNVTSNANPIYWKNLAVSGNTFINTGNTALSANSSPDIIIENNRIVLNWNTSTNLIGINVVRDLNRGQDLDSERNNIRNNTIWFGPNTSGTNTGIWTNTAGTGHIIANNTVTSEQAGGTLNCFRHDLPLTSYAFMNNNHCHSVGTYKFEYTSGSLAAWQLDSGFDSSSITGAPLFVDSATHDFTPDTLSPLVGSGTNLHKSTTDIVGTVRPNPPAIGAYEP